MTPVWEGGELIEARYWIGSDSPVAEAVTGDLVWVDVTTSTPLPLKRVGPVAYSEGVRMASAIYAARAADQSESM